MDIESRAQLLKNIFDSSYELLEEPDYRVIEQENGDQLTLLLSFDPQGCALIKRKDLFNSKIHVGLKIIDFPILGTIAPVLQISTLFPYQIELNASYGQFLLHYLADVPHFPFVELDLVEKQINGKSALLLEISASRNLLPGNVAPEEILVLITTIFGYYEEIVGYYRATLNSE